MELFKIKYETKTGLPPVLWEGRTMYIKSDTEENAEKEAMDDLVALVDSPDDVRIIYVDNVWQSNSYNYICENCNNQFESPEYYTETHGFNDGRGENVYICPCCGSDDIIDKERYFHKLLRFS
jgi:predicted SprT family Zn-dependent metalloprotease